VDLDLDRSGRVYNSLLPILVSLVLGVSSFSQRLNRRDDQPYDLKVPVELVLVPVTVQDKDGKLIYGLHKEDFGVFEEGVPQRITYFSAEPSALSVAILIDRTIDDRTQDIFRQNMLALVEAFSSFDEMALYEYLETAKRLQDFTFDREQLVTAINRVGFAPPRYDPAEASPGNYSPHLVNLPGLSFKNVRTWDGPGPSMRVVELSFIGELIFPRGPGTSRRQTFTSMSSRV
jgi:hypothetical protein